MRPPLSITLSLVDGAVLHGRDEENDEVLASVEALSAELGPRRLLSQSISVVTDDGFTVRQKPFCALFCDTKWIAGRAGVTSEEEEGGGGFGGARPPHCFKVVGVSLGSWDCAETGRDAVELSPLGFTWSYLQKEKENKIIY